MPDTIKISELDEALALADAAEFPYSQENGGERTTFKAPLTQIAAKIVEDMSYAGINLPAGAGVKSVENTLNYLLGAIGGDPNGNISDSYDPATAYVKGDLCIYENALYICTAPTTGTFDPSKWTATTIDNVIGDLSELTTSVTSSLVGAVNEVVKTNTISVSKGSAVNTATVSCYQVGKLVQFFIVGDANTTWGGSSEIATGLPIPKDTNIRYGIHKTSAGSPYGMGTTYQCSIDSNGKLVPMYIPSGAIGNGDYFFISFCYVAKDLQ